MIMKEKKIEQKISSSPPLEECESLFDGTDFTREDHFHY